MQTRIYQQDTTCKIHARLKKSCLQSIWYIQMHLHFQYPDLSQCLNIQVRRLYKRKQMCYL